MKEPASKPSSLITASQPPAPASVPCEHNTEADQQNRQHITITVSENPERKEKTRNKTPTHKRQTQKISA